MMIQSALTNILHMISTIKQNVSYFKNDGANFVNILLLLLNHRPKLIESVSGTSFRKLCAGSQYSLALTKAGKVRKLFIYIVIVFPICLYRQLKGFLLPSIIFCVLLPSINF